MAPARRRGVLAPWASSKACEFWTPQLQLLLSTPRSSAHLRTPRPLSPCCAQQWHSGAWSKARCGQSPKPLQQRRRDTAYEKSAVTGDPARGSFVANRTLARREHSASEGVVSRTRGHVSRCSPCRCLPPCCAAAAAACRSIVHCVQPKTPAITCYCLLPQVWQLHAKGH